MTNKLFAGNLADGIVLDYPLARRYILTHKCAQGCHLDMQNVKGHDYQIICPQHGIVTAFNQVKKWQAEQMKQTELRGKSDLHEPTGESEEELLKSLGF